MLFSSPFFFFFSSSFFFFFFFTELSSVSIIKFLPCWHNCNSSFLISSETVCSHSHRFNSNTYWSKPICFTQAAWPEWKTELRHCQFDCECFVILCKCCYTWITFKEIIDTLTMCTSLAVHQFSELQHSVLCKEVTTKRHEHELDRQIGVGYHYFISPAICRKSTVWHNCTQMCVNKHIITYTE